MKKLLFLLPLLLMFLSCQSGILNQNNLTVPNPTCQHDYALTEIMLGKTPVPEAGLFTCSKCKGNEIRTITYEDISMPILDIDGLLSIAGKDNKVPAVVSFSSDSKSVQKNATIKVQGSEKAIKKNYTIQFYKDGKLTDKDKVRLNENWNKESRYLLRATNDSSLIRDLLAADIFGEITRTRGKSDYSALPDGGAQDGMLTAVFIQGRFYGIYTLLPSEKASAFDMKEEDDHFLLSGESWSRMKPFANTLPQDWEVEEGDKEKATASFLSLYDFVSKASDEEFKAHISEYMDLGRTIDVMLFKLFTADNSDKDEMLWTSFDGHTWAPTPYHMDSTFGLSFGGRRFLREGAITYDRLYGSNKLWARIYTTEKDEMARRYQELRQTVLSEAHLSGLFDEYLNSIPDYLYAAERQIWNLQPGSKLNHKEELPAYAFSQLKMMDELFLQ